MRTSSLPKPPARVAVATSADVPRLDRDGPVLLDALADAGAITDVVVWDDAAVYWQSYDLVLVRSTWDYHRRRDEFLSWAQRCRATSNPADVLLGTPTSASSSICGTRVSRSCPPCSPSPGKC